MKLKQYILLGYVVSMMIMIITVIWAAKQMLIMETEGPFLIGMVFLACVIGTIVSQLLLFNVFTSLKQLKGQMQKLAQKEFIPLTLKRAPKEFQDVAEAFNSMSSQLEQAFQEIEDAEKQKRVMMAQLTHDIKTPITSIQQTISGLLDGVIRPEEQEEYLQNIHKQTIRLNDLVEELGQLTLEEMQSTEEKSMVLMDKLLLEVLGAFQYQLEQEQRELQLTLSPETIRIYTEERTLYRILYNLVHNAIRYSNVQTPITIDISFNGKILTIRVTDEGQGISEKDLPHIFEALYRVEASRNMNNGGHGLGLAIVKEQVERLKGRIEVVSELGKGSTFVVSLPIDDKCGNL